MFSFGWEALNKREIYIKGWIPRLVSKTTIVSHSWQDFRGKECYKKEKTPKHLWSWAPGLKGAQTVAPLLILTN